jgi:hypothetical protein
MARFLLSKQSALVAAALSFLTGCPDTDGSINDFKARSESFRANGDHFPDMMVVEPAGFFDASGTHFLSLAASVDPSKPIMFRAEVVVDATDDMNPTIAISLQPLSAKPEDMRMEVGEPLTTDPVPLNRMDGKFEINYGRVLIHGAADPILPDQEIEADLVLTGQTNSETEVCGTISGELFRPAPLALAGSFGSIAVEVSALPTQPVVSACSAGGG